MFVGFTEVVKGYRLWRLKERKCITNRDVIFRENEMFMQKNSVPEQTPQELSDKIEVEQTLIPN